MTKTGENELIKPFIFLGLLFGWSNWLYVKSARKIAKNYQLITASNQIFSCSLDYSSIANVLIKAELIDLNQRHGILRFLFLSQILYHVYGKESPIGFSDFPYLKLGRASKNAEWTSGLRFERNFGSGSRDRKNPTGDPHGTRAGQMGPFRSCPLGFFHVVPARKRSRFSHTRN